MKVAIIGIAGSGLASAILISKLQHRGVSIVAVEKSNPFEPEPYKITNPRLDFPEEYKPPVTRKERRKAKSKKKKKRF